MTLLPVTEEMLAEIRRLSYEAIAQGAPLAVLPATLLSLVEAVEEGRRPPKRDPWPYAPKTPPEEPPHRPEEPEGVLPDLLELAAAYHSIDGRTHGDVDGHQKVCVAAAAKMLDSLRLRGTL